MKKRIPITIPFEEDELLNSWELRIAYANLYTSRKSFVEDWSKGQLLVRDTFGYSRGLIGGSFYHDKQAQVYEKHSLYPFFAPFFNRQKQEKILYAQRVGYDKTSPIANAGTNVSAYRFCPECAQEDPRIYLHRAHQLPGVEVCHLHGCRLITLEKKFNGEEMLSIKSEKPNYDVQPFELSYARFMKEFMDSAFDMTVEDLHKMIEIRVKELNLTTPQEVKELFNSDFRPISNTQAKYILSSPKTLSEKFLFDHLYSIFGDMFSFKRIFREHIQKDTPNALPKEVLQEGYELISPYKRNIMEVKHEKCGQSFLITEHGLSDLHLRCPDCTHVSHEELYQRMFDSIANDDFTLLSPFKEKGEKVKVKHSCGHEFMVKPVDFYYYNRGCPKCLSKHSLKDVQKKVDAVDPTWKVLSYENLESQAEFLHTTCNQQVKRRFNDFLRKGMYCPHCRKKAVMNKTPGFVEKMQEMVGDEYELVGPYNGDRQPIKIRHKDCGLITEYPRAAYFLGGQRCPLCYGTISNDDLVKYVKERSSGMYEVKNFLPKSEMEILNPITGEAGILSKKILLQELERLNRSELLPCKKDKTVKRPLSQGGVFLRELQQKFNNKSFSRKDIMNLGWTKSQTTKNLTRLVSLGLAENYDGTYKLIEQQDEEQN